MSKQLIPAQRREMIREYVASHQIIRSVDLSQLLAVSEATVRRDLEVLESQGVLERTHGGAILSHHLQGEPAYSHSAQVHAEEKRRIGAAAASLVEEGDVIFVDSGTTATQVIHHLNPSMRLTVITNNVRAAIDMQESGIEVILLGGVLRPRANSTVGPFALDALSHVYADKTFLGVDGLSLKYGCTVPVDSEAQVMRSMVERTRGPVVIVADHSKWRVASNYEVASLDQVHCLVTDDGFDLLARAELEARSVRVIVAEAAAEAGDEPPPVHAA